MIVFDLIKKSLEYYDKQNDKYKKYIVNTRIEIDNNIIFIYDSNNNLLLNTPCEVLGMFDEQTRVWLWGWLLPYLNINETTLTRKLLNYGLKLEPKNNVEDHFYIKSQLVNSRFIIQNNIEIDITISLASYLLKDNHMFIVSKKDYLTSDKSKYFTIYYIIKNI